MESFSNGAGTRGWAHKGEKSMGPCNMSHNSTISHTISPSRSFRREQTSNMCTRVHARFRHCFINTRSGSRLLSETKSRNRSGKYRGLYRILSRCGGGREIVKIEGIPAPIRVFEEICVENLAYSFPFFPRWNTISLLPFSNCERRVDIWRMIYCTFARFYFAFFHGEFNIVRDNVVEL